MRDTIEYDLDGNDYFITHWGAMDALRMQTRLVPFLKPVFAALTDSQVLDIDTEKLDPAAMMASGGVQQAMAELVDVLAKSGTPELIRDLVKGVEVIDHSGEEPEKFVLDKTFDRYFAGRTATIYRLLPKIMEVQYGDFFGLLSSLFGKTQAMRARTKPTETAIRVPEATPPAGSIQPFSMKLPHGG